MARMQIDTYFIIKSYQVGQEHFFFPVVNRYWLFLVMFLSIMCLEMDSRGLAT